MTVLNSLEENEWLYENFGTYGGTNRDLWIGALDNVTEGSWFWYTGTTSGDGVLQIIYPVVLFAWTDHQNGRAANLIMHQMRIVEQLGGLSELTDGMIMLVPELTME